MLKYISLIIIIFTSFLISCRGEYTEIINIEDVGKKQNFVLDFDIKNNETADKIKLKLKGNLNDTAKIGQYFILPGEVDTAFKHDWYANEYILDYYSYKAKNGNLDIKVTLIAY